MLKHPEWALCLGGASSVWEDVKAWEAIYGQPWDGLVICANDIGCWWPHALHHWVSLHPNKFRKWQDLRYMNGFAPEDVLWGQSDKMPGWPWIRAVAGMSETGVSMSQPTPVPYETWTRLGVVPMQTWGRVFRKSEQQLADHQVQPWPGGSSGMFAVQVAQLVGCTRAIICGIPMTSTPHFAETKERFGKQWAAAPGHWKAWTRQYHLMQGWVKSMSGKTQELLGAPTLEWLTKAPRCSSC